LVESFPLKKEEVILREIAEELKILFQGPWVEVDRGVHPFGL
jgi:hypothetical protein